MIRYILAGIGAIIVLTMGRFWLELLGVGLIIGALAVINRKVI